MKHLRDSLKKFSWVVTLVLVVLCSCFVSCTHAPTVSEPGGGVAVWDLDDLSPGLARESLGELFAAQVMEVLTNKGTYTVVERVRLLRVLEELRLGSSSLADEQTRMRLGKLVGARLMVFGGYQVIGGQMRVDLRMVDVETGTVVKAVQKTTTTSDITGWIDVVRKAAEEF